MNSKACGEINNLCFSTTFCVDSLYSGTKKIPDSNSDYPMGIWNFNFEI